MSSRSGIFVVTRGQKGEMVPPPKNMHALLLKRFFQKPRQIAYVVPSSRTLTRRVTDKMDLSRPRVIVEYGPGEGCHSREILSRMHPGSHLILIELDEELVACLQKQFHNRSDVTIVHGSAADVIQILAQHGYTHCDYIISGIPFSILPPPVKRDILERTNQALCPEPHSAFLVYQVTRELRDGGHCDHFVRCETEFCFLNFPPMWISVFYRTAHAPAEISSDFPSKNAMVEA